MAGGELFVEHTASPTGEELIYLYLFNETAGARIHPEASIPQSQVLDAVSSLRLEWRG